MMPSLRLPILILLVIASAGAAEPWLDPVRLAAIPDPDEGPWKIVEGTLPLTTTVADNPTVEVRYATAVGPDGRPAPRSRDLVCWFCFPTERDFQHEGLYRRLVEKAGFTILGIHFPGKGGLERMDPGDRTTYLWAESGSFDAYRRAILAVRAKLGLPDAPVLTLGDSGGGMASQHFSQEYPKLVDAMVSMAGQSFLWKSRPACPHLILSTLGDSTNDEALGLARYCGYERIPAIVLLSQPRWEMRSDPRSLFCHCIDENARELAYRYLVGIADLRRSAQGRLPAAEAWPYAARTSDPGLVLATTTPDWQKRLPADDRVLLPSAAAYAAWAAIPPRISRVVLPGGAVVRVARPAGNVPITGLLLYGWRADAPGLDLGRECDWDLAQAVNQGWVAVAISGGLSRTTEMLAVARSLVRGTEGLPVVAFHRNPLPGDLAGAAAAPGLVAAIAALRADADAKAWSDECARLAAARCDTWGIITCDDPAKPVHHVLGKTKPPCPLVPLAVGKDRPAIQIHLDILATALAIAAAERRPDPAAVARWAEPLPPEGAPCLPLVQAALAAYDASASPAPERCAELARALAPVCARLRRSSEAEWEAAAAILDAGDRILGPAGTGGTEATLATAHGELTAAIMPLSGPWTVDLPPTRLSNLLQRQARLTAAVLPALERLATRSAGTAPRPALRLATLQVPAQPGTPGTPGAERCRRAAIALRAQAVAACWSTCTARLPEKGSDLAEAVRSAGLTIKEVAAAALDARKAAGVEAWPRLPESCELLAGPSKPAR